MKVRSSRAALCDPPRQLDPGFALPDESDDPIMRRLWADTKRVQLWCAKNGDHTKHHDTCHKLPQGRFGCRMCFDKPHGNARTRVVQLSNAA